MASWEDMKRAGQTAFLLAGDAFKDVHDSIGSAYQQLLITGHLYSLTGKESMTQQIVEGRFGPAEPEHEPLFSLNHFHGHDPQQDVEPER